MPETLDEIKKYVGPFSGPQMDQIFYEILNYTSERYAKGTANGVPVAAGTPGYNDNSLFYKNQAAAQVSLAQDAAAAAANSAQRAESAVPAGTDAAVLWTRDQSTELTADDKAVARKNIMAGGTNPNLLDNPWFTVNQRSFTSSTGTNAVKIQDRWYINNGTGGTVTANADGSITINANGGSGYVSIEQRIPNDFTGKTLTVSILLDDGTIISATGTAPTRTTAYQSFAVASRPSQNFELRATAVPASITNYGATTQIVVYQGGQITIKAWKLELGSVSTLANDAPPDFAEELAKCQRYFYRFDFSNKSYFAIAAGLGVGGDTIRFSMFTPVPMRVLPSISFTGRLTAFADGSAIAQQGLTSQIIAGNLVSMSFTTSANAVTVYKAYTIGVATQSGYIDFSADL